MLHFYKQMSNEVILITSKVIDLITVDSAV